MLSLYHYFSPVLISFSLAVLSLSSLSFFLFFVDLCPLALPISSTSSNTFSSYFVCAALFDSKHGQRRPQAHD